jgi:hypothetical protein
MVCVNVLADALKSINNADEKCLLGLAAVIIWFLLPVMRHRYWQIQSCDDHRAGKTVWPLQTG